MNPLIALTAILATAQAGLLASPYAGLPLIGGALPYNYGGLYAGSYAAPILPTAAPVKVETAEPIKVATYAAPAAIPAAPIVAAAPIPAAPITSQYRAQDEFGNVDFGYSNPNSARHERGNAAVGVSGSYTYVDGNGEIQTVNYIADGLGFRVSATNLPVAPVDTGVAPEFNLEAPVDTGVAPKPVEETDEVKAAKAEFLAKFEEAASRSKRSTPAATTPLVPAAVAPYALASPALYNGYAYPNNLLGYNGFYGYNGLVAPGLTAAAPLTYAAAPVAAPVAAPATTVPATLTQIKLNPGYATFYKVDQN